MRIALVLALTGLGCSGAAEPSVEGPTTDPTDQATATGLSLHLDSVRVERGTDYALLRCQARWVNDTGAALAGDTCCSGEAFDGLTVVVRDSRGAELLRRSYLEHQSPFAESVPFTLPPGPTGRELVFMLDAVPAGPIEVQLEGGVIGNAEHAEGYRSETRSARVP